MEGLSTDQVLKADARVARKNGMKLVKVGNHSQSMAVKRSRMSRFMDFSSGSRNTHTVAKAQHESMHLFAAGLLAEQHRLDQASHLSDAERSVWHQVKQRRQVQRNFWRQDLLSTHPELLANNNVVSRTATRLSKACMSACECTSAPTGFSFRALRNLFCRGVNDNSIRNKAAVAGASVFVGVAAGTMIASIRGAMGFQGAMWSSVGSLMSGLFVSFAAFSGSMGLGSFLFGNVSQRAADALDPTAEQKEFIEHRIDSVLNKLNIYLASCAQRPGAQHLLARYLNIKIGASHRVPGGDPATQVPELLQRWTALLASKPANPVQAARQLVGEYLNEGGPAEQRQREKHFAALAGVVEHLDVSDRSDDVKSDRRDGRVWTEDTMKEINRWFLAKLGESTIVRQVCGNRFSRWMQELGHKDYEKIQKKLRETPGLGHLYKLDSDYMQNNLHQYGRVTRFLMRASNFVHSFNHNYVLAVNAQSSRAFNAVFRSFQEHVLGQHSSRTMCAALGRFCGGMLVAAVVFFGTAGIGTLLGLATKIPLAGTVINIFVTGTMMTLVGSISFLLEGAAKLAVQWEGWQGEVSHQSAKYRANPSHAIAF